MIRAFVGLLVFLCGTFRLVEVDVDLSSCCFSSTSTLPSTTPSTSSSPSDSDPEQ
uniref:Uncharacterized protein n=1 Tax=Phakopsora pachyrhizi TaxID=170000 RepID=A0A0S1MJJ2_PHAPC